MTNNKAIRYSLIYPLEKVTDHILLSETKQLRTLEWTDSQGSKLKCPAAFLLHTGHLTKQLRTLEWTDSQGSKLKCPAAFLLHTGQSGIFY